MKKLLVGLFMMFVGVASATTINLSWMVDNNTYAQTTCESGGNLNIPSTTPTKRGYHFIGWDLPDYTLLDYIGFSGTQYIDTGVKFSGSVTELDATVAVTSLGVPMTLAATQNNSASPTSRWGSMQWASGAGKFGTAVGSTPFDKGLMFDASANVQTYIKIVTNNTNKSLTATYGDITKTMTYAGSLNTNLNLLIGAKNTDTGVAEYFNGKVYSMSLKKDDVLVFNFVPARRNSDNVLGMYDTVSGQFFTNQGTGDFIAGPLSANQTLE